MKHGGHGGPIVFGHSGGSVALTDAHWSWGGTVAKGVSGMKLETAQPKDKETSKRLESILSLFPAKLRVEDRKWKNAKND